MESNMPSTVVLPGCWKLNSIQEHWVDAIPHNRMQSDVGLGNPHHLHLISCIGETNVNLLWSCHYFNSSSNFIEQLYGRYVSISIFVEQPECFSQPFIFVKILSELVHVLQPSSVSYPFRLAIVE